MLGLNVGGGVATVVDAHPAWWRVLLFGVPPAGLEEGVGDCRGAVVTQNVALCLLLLGKLLGRKLCSFLGTVVSGFFLSCWTYWWLMKSHLLATKMHVRWLFPREHSGRNTGKTTVRPHFPPQHMDFWLAKGPYFSSGGWWSGCCT